MAVRNLTFQELCEELQKIEETELMELLEIDSIELIDKFQDKIEDNFDKLLKEVDNLNEEYEIYDED
jgi:hypothetical protein|tara:strand:+ start:347 stop:547 length:201 start_codon:yes stop_codon:yes gene_type:complete